MRINEETVLIGSKVVLVPYRKEHVEKYHGWMSNDEIRQQTASEPLTLEEEYGMQRSWQHDNDKLTFIILANTARVGDRIEEILKSCPMAGDVNLFLSQRASDDSNETTASSIDAELEVMIAEPEWRHEGLAYEALTLLIHYASNTHYSSGHLPLHPSAFLSKIGFENHPSIRLFDKLGFEEVHRSEIWKEIEYRPKALGAQLQQLLHAPIHVMRWPLPLNHDALK